MVFRLLHILHLFFIFCISHYVVCKNISAKVSTTQRVDLDATHSLAPTKLPFLSNGTSTSNVFLPYRFRVPDTGTVLRIGFGLPRHKIDFEIMEELLDLSESVVDDSLRRFGADTHCPRGPGHHQLYEQLGAGIELRIQDVPQSSGFTWQQLHEAVIGLHLYLVEGRRSYETYFIFYNGPGRFPDLNDEPLGRGDIRFLRKESSLSAEEK